MGSVIVRLVAVVVVTSGCGAQREFFTTCPSSTMECAGPSWTDQEAVLFLVGDAGYVEFGENPVLQHLERVVSALDEAGVPVTVLYLGDNVYDAGVRTDHPEDYRLLDAQVRVVRGRSPTAKAFFLAGNHDRANTSEPIGIQRLQNQDDALAGLRAAGDSVRLIPPAGCPGPELIEIKNRGTVVARVLALDSPWWLLDLDAGSICGSLSKLDVLDRLESAMSAEPHVPVIVAAHHPLVTGGVHGGAGSALRRLAYNARLLGEDVNSGPYRDYIARIEAVLGASNRSIIHVAGHEHSLQVNRRTDHAHSWYDLVSGSASKRTAVRRVREEGVETLFAASLPGYMRLDFRSVDGEREILLSVVAGCVADPALPARAGENDLHPIPFCRALSSDRLRTVFFKLIS